jgi:hypothetical protein
MDARRIYALNERLARLLVAALGARWLLGVHSWEHPHTEEASCAMIGGR